MARTSPRATRTRRPQAPTNLETANTAARGRPHIHRTLQEAERQVLGIERIVDEDRTCTEMLTPIRTSLDALGVARTRLLDDYLASCADRLASGDPETAGQAGTEMVQTVRRFSQMS